MILYVANIDPRALPTDHPKLLPLQFQGYCEWASDGSLHPTGTTPELMLIVQPPTHRAHSVYSLELRAHIDATQNGIGVPSGCVFYSAVISGSELILHYSPATKTAYLARTEDRCLSLDDNLTNAKFLTARNCAILRNAQAV